MNPIRCYYKLDGELNVVDVDCHPNYDLALYTVKDALWMERKVTQKRFIPVVLALVNK